MKLINTKEAVGHVLCHDLTQIIPNAYKGARFRKGHIVTEEDIPILLQMGKEHLYVWEKKAGMLHENEAAERLCRITRNQHMTASEAREGKIELYAEISGVFLVNSEKLLAINSIDEITIATRKGNFSVEKGDKLAGMRVIPLVIEEDKLIQAENIAHGEPVLSLLPYRLRKAAVITTGSEVYHGRIQDKFTPVLKSKLAAYGIEIIYHSMTDDEKQHIISEIEKAKEIGAELILCTGGMSVDPDDQTPGAIRECVDEVVTYGAPVFPGAMIMLGYYKDGTPLMGLPGCVMYAKTTVFDLVMPRVVAGVKLTKRDFIAFGEGGLCLNCPECTYPNCMFGK